MNILPKAQQHMPFNMYETAQQTEFSNTFEITRLGG